MFGDDAVIILMVFYFTLPV